MPFHSPPAALNWSLAQILALAPDALIQRSARALATPHRWPELGRDKDHLWGVFAERPGQHIRSHIDLAGPRFFCDCASRKAPCRHMLALALLAALPQAPVSAGPAPAWIRTGSSRRTAKRTEPARRPGADRSRDGRRLAQVRAGLEEFALWLEDMVRQGLADLPEQPRRYWQQMADRLVDAQMSPLARRLRALADLPGRQPDWPARVLRGVGRLYLLIEGFRRLETFEPAVQADLRAAVGWAPKTRQPRGQDIVDTWCLVGRQVEMSGRRQIERFWFRGVTTGRPAVVTRLTAGARDSYTPWFLGLAYTGPLHFLPGRVPLRALAPARQPVWWADAPNGRALGGTAALPEAVAAYSQALAANPWLDDYPWLLHRVWPVPGADSWRIQDERGYHLPLATDGGHHWHLQSLAGPAGLTIFGRWDGALFHPLSVATGSGWLALPAQRSVR